MTSIAARLNQRITIQEPSETEDGYGGTTVSWSDVATVWAEVKPFNTISQSTERFNDSQLLTIQSYRITIRYKSNINTQMRVQFDGRVMNIRGVVNVDSKDHILELIAEEGVA